MLIGMIDQDALLYKYRYPNLELMKLSQFHKNRRDIVEFITDVRQLEPYSKVYLQKEGNDKHFPTKALANKKVQWGGRAFTGTYEPLPEEIDFLIPDVLLYESFLSQQIIQNKIKRVTMTHLFNRNYIRFTHQNELYNSNYLKQINPNKKVIIVYDENFLEYSKWNEIVDSLQNHSLRFVNTHIIKDIEILKKVSSYNNFTGAGDFFFRPEKPEVLTNEILELLGNNKNIILELCSLGTDENSFLYYFVNILDKLYYSYSRGVRVSVGVASLKHRSEAGKNYYTVGGVFEDYFKQKDGKYSPYDIASTLQKSVLLNLVQWIGGSKGKKMIFSPLNKIRSEVWKIGH